MPLKEFTIAPVLGRKTDVPQNDPSLFKDFGGVIATHDVDGQNYDLTRKRHAVTKSQGFSEWSNSANAQATKCLGLFRLDDGTNTNYCYWDNGKFYVYDGNLDPQDKTTAATTYTNNNTDLICALKLGSDVVFTGYGWESSDPPQAWANGDASAAKIYSAGTEYQFRILVYFARRLVGLYSDQTNGDIDIRWSNALPTAQTDCEFAAANQLYVVNDDPIRGAALLGQNQCSVYCEDSINAMTYYPDYETPFRMHTAIQGQGAVNHHSIISLGNIHYLFNKNYGFCAYAGGQFPHGGKPISLDIETDISGINTAYYNLIVGAYDRINKKLVWLVPTSSASAPDQIWEYDLYTQTWAFRDYAARYLAMWELYSNYTWNDLISELGGTGALWSYAGTNIFARYASENTRLVIGGTDGKLYTEGGESFPSGTNDGYRVEPILDFGDPKRKDLLQEIWWDLGQASDCRLHIYHRGGDTVGEVTNAAWEELHSSDAERLSHNSPDKPCVYLAKSSRLHQIKWRTDNDNELFQVHGITFRYTEQSEN